MVNVSQNFGHSLIELRWNHFTNLNVCIKHTGKRLVLYNFYLVFPSDLFYLLSQIICTLGYNYRCIRLLCIIFDEALGITAITPWIVLIAALLLTIAFEKLFPSHWIKRHFKKGFNEAKENIHREFRDSDHNRTSGNSGIDENAEYDDSEYIYHSVKMGSGSKYVNSKNLKSADLSIEFGDLSVYLDKAEVPGKEVTINTKVAFGNMDLYIPRDWNITNKVSVSMGECDDHASSIYGEEGGVHCTINGSVAFGELAIHKV